MRKKWKFFLDSKKKVFILKTVKKDYDEANEIKANEIWSRHSRA